MTKSEKLFATLTEIEVKNLAVTVALFDLDSLRTETFVDYAKNRYLGDWHESIDSLFCRWLKDLARHWDCLGARSRHGETRMLAKVLQFHVDFLEADRKDRKAFCNCLLRRIETARSEVAA